MAAPFTLYEKMHPEPIPGWSPYSLMTSEQLLILIASILIPLGSLILVQSRAIRSELREAVRERTELRERMAHLEGLLEGLREAITRQPAA